MRDIGRNLAHARHQRFDAIKHTVEVGRQPVEFFIHADHRHALVQPPGHDGGDRLVQPFEPLRKDGGDHIARDQGEEGYAEPAPQRDRIEPFTQFLHVMGVRSDDQSRAARKCRYVGFDRSRFVRQFPRNCLVSNDRDRPAKHRCRLWQVACHPQSLLVCKKIPKRPLSRCGPIANCGSNATRPDPPIDCCQSCRFVRQRV